MKIGILPLARPTFDVEFAEQNLEGMLECLGRSSHTIVGPRELLFDEDATLAAMSDLEQQDIDHLLIMQVTFTDASLTIAAANKFDQPLSIWAIGEPRIGGRLRLNSFCGLNLASHALGLAGREFSWMLADPGDMKSGDLGKLFEPGTKSSRPQPVDATDYASPAGEKVAAAIEGRRIARIGEHPVGFDTCAYSPEQINKLAGVDVDALELDELFDAARNAEDTETERARQIAEADVAGLTEVNEQELKRSLRLKAGLDAIKRQGKYDAFAIRCWPETFTEYGGAVCGPVAMMGEGGTPCACEADVYGSLAQMLLQEASGGPVFLTDLVDMDVEDNTGVVWHCGQAPISMRDPDIQPDAAIHTNRKMPLLYQFPLKPGLVTFMRISQAFNEPRMVICSGEMLKRPMAFTGTSGVVRFERPAGQVLDDIIACGLEHHMALAYGDHRDILRSVAGAMNLPLLEL